MRINIISVIISILLIVSALPSQAKITTNTTGVMTYQILRSEDQGGSLREEPSFTRPLVNFHVNGRFDGGFGLKAEVYAGKRSDTSQPNIDTFRLGELYGNSGRWFEPVKVRAGVFEIDYGTQFMNRSDHGDVQRNPLIGNHLPDFHAQQLGVEFAGDISNSSWSLGLTNGTDQVEINPSRGTGFVANFQHNFSANFSLRISGYRIHHSDTTADRANNNLAFSNLFGSKRASSDTTALSELQSVNDNPYAGIKSGLGASPNVLVLGRDVKAWQIDASYDPTETLSFKGFHGIVQDEITNSGTNTDEIEWAYNSYQGVYSPIGSDWELALRYGTLNAKSLQGIPNLGNIRQNGEYKRLQVGANYQISDNILAKVEFIRGYENITSRNLEFDGLVFEVSAAGLPKLQPDNVSKNLRK